MMGLFNTLAVASGRPTLIKDGLSAWWDMDEATSAARVDKVGAVSLADVGACTQVAGLVGNATGYTGSGQHNDKAADAAFTLNNTSCSVAMWVKYLVAPPAQNTAYLGRIGKYTIEAGAGVPPNHQIHLGAQIINVTGALAINTWWFVGFSVDQSRMKVVGWVNVTQEESALSALMADANDSGFFVGAVNAQIDSIGIWKRNLSPSEITWLYNAGAGRAYSSL